MINLSQIQPDRKFKGLSGIDKGILSIGTKLINLKTGKKSVPVKKEA
jgi:hypothetical protein